LRRLTSCSFASPRTAPYPLGYLRSRLRQNHVTPKMQSLLATSGLERRRPGARFAIPSGLDGIPAGSLSPAVSRSLGATARAAR
jgi:hypothetical protein